MRKKISYTGKIISETDKIYVSISLSNMNLLSHFRLKAPKVTFVFANSFRLAIFWCLHVQNCNFKDLI